MAYSPDTYLRSDPSGVPVAVPGATSSASPAGRLVALGPNGTLDPTLIPGNLQISRRASEAIAAGALINYWSDPAYTTGVSIRNADNSSVAKRAHGFALAAIASGATGTVMEGAGQNNAMGGLTPGVSYFLGSMGAESPARADPPARPPRRGSSCSLLESGRRRGS